MNATIATLAATAVLVSGLSSALATEQYPVLEAYQKLAIDLAQKGTKTSGDTKSQGDLDLLTAGARTLLNYGIEIMKIYGRRNPKCQPQFDVFLREVPDMGKQSMEILHKRYHDGDGLPVGPKHCYFGRSEIVHPVMILSRLSGPWSAKARDAIVDDFNEVARHINRIKKNLENPPN